jgi:hypothetical protein
MKSPKDSFFGFGVIILDKMSSDSDSCELDLRIGFHEKSPSVSKNLRFDDVTISERCFYFFEWHNYFIRFIRYCPYPFFIIGFARSLI